MRFLRTCLGVFTLIAAIMATQTSVVQADTDAELTPELIQTYSQKISLASAVQKDLQTHLQCFEDEHTRLMSRSSQLETDLGQNRALEDKLEPAVNNLTEQVNAFQKNLTTAKINYNNTYREWQRLKAEKHRQERDVQHCKDQWWTINALCDLAADFLRAIGEFETVDGKLITVKARLTLAEQALDSARYRLNDSSTKLNDVRSRITVIRQEIAAAEAEITQIKASLADMRVEEQSFKTEIDALNYAIDEANSVDTEDAKRRILRKMERLSGNLDTLITQSADILTNARSFASSNNLSCSA